jgi:hypothetical protein
MKSQLESTASFNGSSRVEAVASEMRQLTPEPAAILIGGNEKLAAIRTVSWINSGTEY